LIFIFLTPREAGEVTKIKIKSASDIEKEIDNLVKEFTGRGKPSQ